jgi:hypothetical protein
MLLRAVTTYPHLNSLCEGLQLVRGELHSGGALRDKGNDGDAGVAAHHRTVHQGGVQAL